MCLLNCSTSKGHWEKQSMLPGGTQFNTFMLTPDYCTALRCTVQLHMHSLQPGIDFSDFLSFADKINDLPYAHTACIHTLYILNLVSGSRARTRSGRGRGHFVCQEREPTRYCSHLLSSAARSFFWHPPRAAVQRRSMRDGVHACVRQCLSAQNTHVNNI